MKTFKDTNILVTGGTGFVGSHLVQKLIKLGARVTTTYQQTDPHSYFFQEHLDKKVIMKKVDIADMQSVYDLITRNEIEYIFHLAAQPLVDVAYYNPLRTLESNIMGTANLLETVRLYPQIKGIIVASSDKAYGKLDKDKYHETDALKGDHPYEVSKSAADLICTSYFKTYQVPVVITRFGNIYGEGDMNFSRLIPTIMKSVIQKESIDIRSDGTYVRDFLYVKDVVDGYLLLANNIEKAKGEAYNFGSTDTKTVLEVLDIAQKALSTQIDYKIRNIARNEIPYQSLDFTKIATTFSWTPQYSLFSELPHIYKWYAEHL